MKAVIMAGGEGTRLRPLSLGRPKPMTSLFGRPVMEHILTLLRRHGFRDICVTLCYRPEAVRAMPNTLADFMPPEGLEDVVWVCDVSHKGVELYYDMVSERLLILSGGEGA